MDHLKLTLLIASFVIPLLLSVSIFAIAKNDFPKLIMGFAQLNTFYVFFANYFYFQSSYYTYSILHSLHIASVLWLFPSVYLYVMSIIESGKSFKKELIHLLPGAIFGIISALLFYLMLNEEERIFYLSNYRTGIEFENSRLKLVYIFRAADVAVIVAQVIYYSIVFIRIPGKYNERLLQEYSNIENFSVNWIKWFNLLFVSTGLLCILFYVFNPLKDDNQLFLVSFLFFISAFIWLVGIWSFKQQKPKQFYITNDLEIKLGKLNSAKLNETQLAEKLIDYFEKETPYLDSELNLSTVCKEIGTNRTYLSGVINKTFGVNFNTFVNQYRIKYIQKYIKENPDTSKEELVQIGGFGSLSSLKRATTKKPLLKK